MKNVTCESAVELLAEYVDGSMEASLRAAFEAHIADCPPCVDFLQTYRATIAVSRKACDVPVPSEVQARLRAFLREKCDGGKR